MDKTVAVFLHVAPSVYSRGLIDTITSLAGDSVLRFGDPCPAALGRALSELDASDRAGLESAIPALARLADAIAQLAT